MKLLKNLIKKVQNERNQLEKHVKNEVYCCLDKAGFVASVFRFDCSLSEEFWTQISSKIGIQSRIRNWSEGRRRRGRLQLIKLGRGRNLG